MSEYNGWTNHATWAAHLWLTNESASDEYWHEQAKEIVGKCEDKHPNVFCDKPQNERIMLASMLSSEIEQPELDGLAGDLLSGAWSSINWYEIAEAFLNSAREELKEEGE